MSQKVYNFRDIKPLKIVKQGKGNFSLINLWIG